MWKKVMQLFTALPIVRLLTEHRADRVRSDAIAAESMAQQHDIARRVHVLEWMTFPHTRPNPNKGDHS